MAEGIVIIDKPADWTSMDVCAKLRGILKTKKVGHAGTLDPMATGVLPIFVGQATRGVSFAESGEKEYVATLRLGLTTDTQDSTGTTLSTTPVTVTRADVEAVLPQFMGEIAQIPPMYSAIKIGGQKLYDLARQGKEVERKPRTVTIDEVQEKGEAVLRQVDTLFRQYGEYHISHPRVEFLCRNGNPFIVHETMEEGLYRVYGMDGMFLCLSRLEGGQMTSVKNFFGA